MKFPDVLLDTLVKMVEEEMASSKPWCQNRPITLQCVRGLAYLYAKADTPFRQSGKIADAIRKVYGSILTCSDRNCHNRLMFHVAETKVLLAETGAEDLLKGIDDYLAKEGQHYAEALASYRHLTCLTSSNLGTGTNHVAFYVCLVHRIAMLLQREEWLKLSCDIWDRMVAHQSPDGYWAETTGGPAVSYNHITMACAGRMARLTGNQTYHDSAQRAAHFQRRFSYPDGANIETIDGRVRYHTSPTLNGGFVHSETSEGRAYVARKIETFLRLYSQQHGPKSPGEASALLAEDHEYWKSGPVGDLLLDRPHYVEELKDPAAVRRHGSWVTVLQGLLQLPRPWGSFTVDRTSLMSIWHKQTGLIVNGSGEPGSSPSQTFHFRSSLEYDDAKTPYAIPEVARVAMGRPGTNEAARIVAEYRGGTGTIEVQFVSDEEIRLQVGANTRTDKYPVPFALQLELRKGDSVNGVELGEGKVELSGKELGGKLVAKDRFSVEFDRPDAKFLWPYDPYNPYDGKEHKSPANLYVSLLTIPVGPEGMQVQIKVG